MLCRRRAGAGSVARRRSGHAERPSARDLDRRVIRAVVNDHDFELRWVDLARKRGERRG